MSYDGTPTPANYQGPNDPRASPEQIQMMQAIAKALLGNQQPFMQHWTQPLAQMAQSAVGMQMLNRIMQASRANAAGMMPPVGPSSMPMPQQPAPPQQPLPPVAANPMVPQGPTGNPSAISSMPGAPKSLGGFDPFFGLFGGT